MDKSARSEGNRFRNLWRLIVNPLNRMLDQAVEPPKSIALRVHMHVTYQVVDRSYIFIQATSKLHRTGHGITNIKMYI